jgi:hypothetical protein
MEYRNMFDMAVEGGSNFMEIKKKKKKKKEEEDEEEE